MIDENYEDYGKPPNDSQHLVGFNQNGDGEIPENIVRVKTEPGTTVSAKVQVHESKKPGECSKCKVFANLSQFSLLDQKAIKT